MPEEAYRIVVNLMNRQLHLLKGDRVISTFPVGIGKALTRTPEGEYSIVNKVPHPGGPFGAYWLGLSRPHYGIHGTNRPSSIGKRVSKGCIRMFNQDVLWLANRVPVGTRVTIQA